MQRIQTGLALAFVCIAAMSTHASADELPFRAIIVNPLREPDVAFAVRSDVPTATATNYNLGPFLCAVFPGTTLYATDERQIANGEIWYFVQVETSRMPLGPSECAAGSTGWMVGQLKSGSLVVAIKTPHMAPPKEAVKSTEQKKEVKTSGEEAPYTFWWYYIFLVAGTFLSVVILTWERHREVSLAPLLKRIVIVECLLLAIANVLILAIVIPLYCSIETKSSTALLLQRSTSRPDGHFILGFVLSVLLLKSVSFVKESNSTDSHQRI